MNIHQMAKEKTYIVEYAAEGRPNKLAILHNIHSNRELNDYLMIYHRKDCRTIVRVITPREILEENEIV